MFNFLKSKLKDAVSKFSKKVEEEVEDKEEEIEEVIEKPKKEEKKKEEKQPEPKEKEQKKEVKKEPAPKKETKEPEKKKEVKEKQPEIKKEPIPKKEKPKPEKKKEEPIKEVKVESPIDAIESEVLEQEKKIIEEEKELQKPEKEEKSEVEQEVKEIIKEEKQKELEEERIEKEKEVEEIEKEKKKSFFSKLFKKKQEETEKELDEAELEEEKVEEPIKEEKKVEEVTPSVEEPIKEEVKEEKPVEKVKEPEVEEKKSFFKRITKKVTTKKISESQFEDFFWDLELALLENNVAVEVIEKIKEDLKQNLVDKALPRSKILETINNTLQSSIKEILEVENINFLKKVEEKKPYVICFVGINGSGKTTSIAKIAKLLQDNKKTCILAAADTFRAAAIDQLQHHADKLDIKMIRQDYGSDPAAVAFDAIKHAEAKNIDVVLIDTAGRMHSNQNLQDEMKKIIRVAKPDLKIFVGESITGNDCTEQAKQFNDSINIDGIILSKQDIDEKGGAALSVSYITKKPILFIGTGQEYEDIKEFTSDIVLDNLGL
jgi:fused signal recognition particle receptor